VDETRYHAAIDPTLLNRIRSMVPAAQTGQPWREQYGTAG
jgi:hypothetical protein